MEGGIRAQIEALDRMSTALEGAIEARRIRLAQAA
jgi:hypothetical protein